MIEVSTILTRSFSVTLLFAWYDVWVGVFWDRTKRRLYILPIPMLGVVIQFPTKEKQS